MPPLARDETELPAELETLRDALRRFKRHLRAGRGGEGGWQQRAASELAAVFDEVLGQMGGVSLRLAADGLYFEEHLLVDVDPEQDEALFRLFRHGVRRIGLEPGLEEEELGGLLEVMTTDYDRPEHVEDDVATAVEDRELVHVQLVVVETFVEGDGGQQQGSFDLAAFVEAAVRPALREGEHTYREGGRALPLWSADARFFRRADVGSLVRELEQGSQGRGAGGATDRERFTELDEELDRGLRSTAPWLFPDVFELLETLDGEAGERAAGIAAEELLRLVEEEGLRPSRSLLREAVGWLAEHLHLPSAVPFAEALFSERLKRAALLGLSRDAERPTALEVIGWFPEELAEPLVEDLLREPPGPARAAALSVLVADSPSAQTTLASRVGHLAADEAFTLVQAVLDADAEELEQFETEGRTRRHGARERIVLMEALAGHEALPVRLQAMRWLAEHGGPMGPRVLARGLRSPLAPVRLAALYLLAALRRREAGEVLSAHLLESVFGGLPLEDQRLVASVALWVGGEPVLRRLRAILRREGEGRTAGERSVAAAVAALGWLPDEETASDILRMARSRATPEVVRQEAVRVVEAIERDESPYPHPREQLRSRLRAAGITRWVRRRRPRREGTEVSLLSGGKDLSVGGEAPTVPPRREAGAASEPEPPSSAFGGLSFSFDSLPVPAPLRSAAEEEP